jgi:ABC-type branched-subunit amino acid transport system substrate-binding protein
MLDHWAALEKIASRRRGIGLLAGLAATGAVAVSAAGLTTTAAARSARSGGNPILIGTIAGTTGAYGSTGVAVVNGAKLGVQTVNAAGGVLGRKLSLTSANDNASATVASQEFEKMVSSGAVAIDGSPDTGPATAAMSSRLKIPDMGVVDDAGLTIYPHGPSAAPLPWAWSFGLNTFAWGQADAEYALKNCRSGLAVLHDPTTYGEGGDDAIRLAYGKAGKKLKLDEAITENWSTGATVQLNTELNKIKSSGADCVVVWLTPQDTAAFAQAVNSAGDKLKVIGNDEINADNTFAKLAGQQGNGAIGAMLTSTLRPSAALKAFDKKYQKEFGVAATPFAAASYDSILVLAQVMRKVHSTSPTALQRGLNSVSNFHGLIGTFSFSKQSHATITSSELTVVQYNAAKGAWLPLKG